MTTMRDVARVAGVSAKTVSRVFNDDPHVTRETRDRVRWAMQKLNYVPNLLARSFRVGADAAVGLAVPDIADPFFAAMAGSIELDLVGRGMAVVITSLFHGGRGSLAAERERAALEALLRRQISGLIVACVSADQSYLAPWQERTPMVFVDRAPKGLSAVYVIEDDLGAAREAVAHLAGHGLSGSHEPVQRRVVYQVDGLGRVFIAEQHALLPFHAAGQPGGHDIGCCSCRGLEQAARIAFRLEHSGNDAW